MQDYHCETQHLEDTPTASPLPLILKRGVLDSRLSAGGAGFVFDLHGRPGVVFPSKNTENLQILTGGVKLDFIRALIDTEVWMSSRPPSCEKTVWTSLMQGQVMAPWLQWKRESREL